MLPQVVLFERAFTGQLAFQAHGHKVQQLICLKVRSSCLSNEYTYLPMSALSLSCSVGTSLHKVVSGKRVALVTLAGSPCADVSWTGGCLTGLHHPQGTPTTSDFWQEACISAGRASSTLSLGPSWSLAWTCIGPPVG